MKGRAPSKHRGLAPKELYAACNPDDLDFETTATVEDLNGMLGQARAVEAIEFGIGIRREGYNLFAMGPTGTGKHSMVRRYLEQWAASQPVPADWCYVHNFKQSHQPSALRLPPGTARKLHHHMQRLVEDLQAAIPAAFETDEYRARLQEIDQEFNEQQEQALTDFRARAKAKSIVLVRTPGGLALSPVRDGEAIHPDTFQNLPEEERQEIESNITSFQGELEKILRQLPQWRRAAQRKIRTLNRAVTQSVVQSLIEELRKEYDGLPEVVQYLSDLHNDVVENADLFRQTKEAEPASPPGWTMPAPEPPETSLNRYRVNVLVDHSESQGAPVVYEDNPTFHNLLGRIEHQAHMGTLMTDFTLIKPGALHRANGGCLIVEALKLLQQPYAWDALKRALRSTEIRTETLGHLLNIASNVSLEPEPIPLQVKVVLLGERFLYYLLSSLDPDFPEIFKVDLDFEEDMDRSPQNHLLYARLLATIARKEGLLCLDRSAAARVIERSSRLAGDATKLSVQMRSIMDLLREADYWARQAHRTLITQPDVERAIEAQIYRSDRLRARLQEHVQRQTLLIDTQGAQIGQINALSVLQLGSFSFGHPSRITARIRLGSGKVVDIEREVELGGPLHSKGVLILSGYLAGHYLPDQPLSLSASLVFEQSYGGVDGDSASSAELYALLSALAQVPMAQALAVTGSVNQRGEIQAIGGVNEKVEGFFDICRQRGLTGQQGVLIPASNVKNLMLRQDVVDAVAKGQFHIHAVHTIDQGLEILSGIPAGQRDGHGQFPPGSLNRLVEDRLAAFAKRARDPIRSVKRSGETRSAKRPQRRARS